MKKIVLGVFVGMFFVSAQAMEQAPQAVQEQMIELADKSLASAEIVQNTLAQVIKLDPIIAKMLIDACQKTGVVANEIVFVLRDDEEGDDAWIEPVDVRGLLGTLLVVGVPFGDVDGIIHPLVRSIVCSFLRIQEKGDGALELVNTFHLPKRIAAPTIEADNDVDDEHDGGGAAGAGAATEPVGLAILATAPGAFRGGAFIASGRGTHHKHKHKHKKGRGGRF